MPLDLPVPPKPESMPSQPGEINHTHNTSTIMMHPLTIAAIQELGHNSLGPVPPKPLVQAEEYNTENAVEQGNELFIHSNINKNFH